jgi:aspartyl aminopeptidase
VSPSRTDAGGELEADGLCRFLDASPSPFHACAEAAERLETAGFQALDEVAGWPTEPGRHYIIRGGSLVAWSTEQASGPTTPFRVVGAHTDSPNLRVKPQPDLVKAGWQMIGVETYGGPLLNSWLDRDLGVSGRVAVRSSGGVGTQLVKIDEPILRVPQLAIHLDRGIREDGLKLDRQLHMAPLWGLGASPADFLGYVGDDIGVERADILGFDLMTHDLTPARRVGRDRDLVASARLDNLATSYAGVRALLRAVDQSAATIPLLVLFDHEEIGSTSERGAQSPLLLDVLERIVLGAGGDRSALLRAIAGSVCASGDMGHATHPNYADRHEPQHHVAMNGGPVLKINTNLRYATDAVGAAAFALACEQADVPYQAFVNRSDLPCGSTIGPMTAARLGMTTVDFGAPTLAMHSTRELCGAHDMDMYVAALAAFLAPG